MRTKPTNGRIVAQASEDKGGGSYREILVEQIQATREKKIEGEKAIKRGKI
jgi:hypothetical protein